MMICCYGLQRNCIENDMLKTLEIVKNAQDDIYAKCGLKFENFSPEDESSEYYAHTFTIKG